MTVTISPEYFYLVVIGVLFILQIYQWSVIRTNKRNFDLQIQNLITGIANALTILEKKIDGKQDK